MSCDLPLVSVCIAAFNSGKYINDTLTSVFTQTYENLEIIVVDDGSQDNTLELLRTISDRRFQYFQQPKMGASSARNLAYKLSKGAFVKFLDSDDLVNAECIEEQLSKIKYRPDCIASAKWGRFYKDDLNSLKVEPEAVWRDLPGIDWVIESLFEKGRNMMQCGMFLIPRAIIEKAGLWNENLSLIDDFEYMIRIISNCSMVLFCEEALLMYRSGVTNNLSGQKSRNHMESAFNAIHLGTNTILNCRDDSISRLACANVFQNWVLQFYPEHMDLYKKSLQKVNELGGSKLKAEGGRMYVILVNLLGWQRARDFKRMITGRS